MTYGEKYERCIKDAQTHINNTLNVSTGGDVWQAKIELAKARQYIIEAENLLMDATKVAFERVFDSKAPR